MLAPPMEVSGHFSLPVANSAQYRPLAVGAVEVPVDEDRAADRRAEPLLVIDLLRLAGCLEFQEGAAAAARRREHLVLVDDRGHDVRRRGR